ncbi:MAG: chemoreceptor glutamine deamidase CheD [Gammaproteobacteria bacterium]|nr:chemoreceptor glutamine deamidase CheD [Gammaproteobacteria bacterium]
MKEPIRNGEPDPKPKALRGFKHINRYWDKSRAMWGAKIQPGQYYVTINNELIVTVLGSCVSACIRDKKLGIGGMNHFMLPVSKDTTNSSWASESERYGNFAMEHLINEILKQGGRRENLEVKIFGGGQIIANMTDVGKKNIAFVRHYIKTEGLKLISEDVGDIHPRKVLYIPSTGKAMVKRLRSLHNETIVEREKDYLKDIGDKPLGGDIELF